MIGLPVRGLSPLLEPPLMSINYALDEYAVWLNSWNAADRTKRDRLIFAERLAKRWPNPRLVTSALVEDFLAGAEFSAWTKSTYFGHLRSIFGWLAKTDRIDRDPTADVRAPKKPAGKPRPLSTHEVNRATAAAGGDLYDMLMLGLLAGFRAFEAAKVHASHVSERELYVVGKGGKESILPTHPTIWAIAQRRGNGYWFPGLGDREHVSSQTVTLNTTQLFGRLGIEGSFHRCRHYYGTSLLRAGVNIRVVQELLRHESLETTARYLGVGEDERRAGILGLAA